DAARDRGERADRREVDHVAGEKLDVPRLVPREQQVVDVELADDAVAALELDRAHGAAAGRAADREDGVHQGAERAQRVRAGALRIADYEHLDRAQLAMRSAPART